MSDNLGNEDIRAKYIEFLQTKKKENQDRLKENDLLINQLNVEINKLSELNRQKTAQLNIVKAQIDTLPRQDIVRAYDEMIDSLRMMIVKRGQLEKLQNEKKDLEEFLDFIRKTNEFLEEGLGGVVEQRGTALLEKLIDAQEDRTAATIKADA